MSVFTKVGGVWKNIPQSSVKTNVSGVWKTVTQVWVNISGVWKQCWIGLKTLLVDWTYRDDLGRIYAIKGVVSPRLLIHAGDRWAAAGNNSSVALSSDGTTWTYCIQPELLLTTASTQLYAAAYNSCILCIVGLNSACIITIDSGQTWTLGSAPLGAATACYALTWNGAVFSAGGTSTTLGYSTNGTTWTQSSSVSGLTTVRCLASNTSNGTMVAVADSGIYYSTNNGVTYTKESGGMGAYTTICFGNNRFIAGGTLGKIATSPDGITWTVRTSLSTGTWGAARQVGAIVWDPIHSQFIAVGATGGCATSPDGITWTYQSQLSSLSTDNFYAMDTDGLGNTVAAGNASNARANCTIPTAWTAVTTNGFKGVLTAQAAWGTNSCASIIWTGSYYVMGGANGCIAVSTDGITWTANTGLSSTTWGTTTTVMGIAKNGSGVLCAIGTASGRCATSPDGVTWTYQAQLATTTWSASGVGNAIAFGNGVFCIVGNGAKCATSPDGITWTYRASLSTAWTTSFNGRAIIYDGTKFIAVGSGSKCATSPDGITWTNRTSLTTVFGGTNVNCIAYNGSVYVACGDLGKVAYSSDATTWFLTTSLSSGTWGTVYPVNAIICVGSVFVIVGNLSRCAESSDGVTWTYQAAYFNNANTGNGICTTYNGSSQLVVGGLNGRVATSP
jgi:hypothetical protein